MERYLEGGEITREEMARALKQLVTMARCSRRLRAPRATTARTACRT